MNHSNFRSLIQMRTLVIACGLALGLIVFAQRRPAAAQPAGYHGVVDLTHPINDKTHEFEAAAKSSFQAKTVATVEHDKYFLRTITLPEHLGTHIDAPAHFAKGLWTVDQIPPERLIAPLVVIDVASKVKQDPDYQLSVEDIAAWEKANGQIPPGAVVVARTGWGSRWDSAAEYRNADAKGIMHFPGFSRDAAQFLTEGREVFGLGIDTLSIDYGPSADFEVHRYTMAHSVYHLENVANLDRVPASGALVIAAPAKLEGGSGGPVRIFALLR